MGSNLSIVRRHSLGDERLLGAAGLDGDKPSIISEMLVCADAMGHTTHGLAQLPGYLREIETGGMAATGEPDIMGDRPSAVLWDGRRLSGVWLTAKAVALAVDRARTTGLCAVTIRRSHHIACLATFLPAAAPSFEVPLRSELFAIVVPPM